LDALGAGGLWLETLGDSRLERVQKKVDLLVGVVDGVVALQGLLHVLCETHPLPYIVMGGIGGVLHDVETEPGDVLVELHGRLRWSGVRVFELLGGCTKGADDFVVKNDSSKGGDRLR
jgi:hypothetical protein